jgi:broad specificity phosphatase PhoE
VSGKGWHIPPSTRQHLQRIPNDRPVAMLVRHSVRNHLPPGEAGNAVPITDEGKLLALELGRMLGQRLRRLHTSPVLRCVQTAECFNDGAGTNVEIISDRLLGDPGAYVLDGQVAWSNWERLGHEGVMRHLVTSWDALPGMARPDEAAYRLVRHMLGVAGDEHGVHVFVTHDLLVAATVAWILGKTSSNGDWPGYLEAAFFWKGHGGFGAQDAAGGPEPQMFKQGVRVAYRDEEMGCSVDRDEGAIS